MRVSVAKLEKIADRIPTLLYKDSISVPQNAEFEADIKSVEFPPSTERSKTMQSLLNKQIFFCRTFATFQQIQNQHKFFVF
jgi:hypothetical protein